MVQSEYARGISNNFEDHSCYSLTLQRGKPCSISTSVNFVTPQHVDIRDGSISIFSWVHIGKPETDGYFVSSNLQVRDAGKNYNGMAIKLVDGLILSGNGHMLCHGNTTLQFLGTIFGIQFSANGVSITTKLGDA